MRLSEYLLDRIFSLICMLVSALLLFGLLWLIETPATLDKHRINGDTDQNQQALKAYRKEGTEIVLPHVSGFPVGDGGKRDGCQTCE